MIERETGEGDTYVRGRGTGIEKEEHAYFRPTPFSPHADSHMAIKRAGGGEQERSFAYSGV